MRRDLWFHARAGVAHSQANVRADLCARAPRRVVLVDPEVLGLDLQPAARRHGVARVDRQVDEHLLDLSGVGHDSRQARAERGDELDVLTDRLP